MKKFITFIACTFCVALLASTSNADHIWVNEIHYDNTGADVGEFIEIGIRTPNGSGFQASDYAVELYNGNGGAAYLTSGILDTGAISDPISVTEGGETEVVTLYTLDIAGIQNGAPDGFAIVNLTNSTVVDNLLYSYEGTFTATDGLATGLTSVALAADEGVFIDAGGSVGASGDGFGADQFGPASFAAFPTTASPGEVNEGQVFTRAAPVPEPSSIAVLGLVGLVGVARRRRK